MNAMLTSLLTLALGTSLGAQEPDFTMTTTGAGVTMWGTTWVHPGTDVSDGYTTNPPLSVSSQLLTERTESRLAATLYAYTSTLQLETVSVDMDMVISAPTPRVMDFRLRQVPDSFPLANLDGVSASIEVVGFGTFTEACGGCETVFENIPVDASGVTVRWSMEITSGASGPGGGSWQLEFEAMTASCMEPYGNPCGAVSATPVIDWATTDQQRIVVRSEDGLPLGLMAIGAAPLAVTLPDSLSGCDLYVDAFVWLPFQMLPNPWNPTAQGVFEFTIPATGTFYFQAFLYPYIWNEFELQASRGLKFECP